MRPHAGWCRSSASASSRRSSPPAAPRSRSPASRCCPSLRSPSRSSSDDPESCPSVQLLLQRCRDAGAAVGPADLSAVAELCRRVDGLPLAIEIAAARARTMSIAEIVRRLDASIDVLDRPRFRGDPRHRRVAEHHPVVLRPVVTGGGRAARRARRVRRPLLRLHGAGRGLRRRARTVRRPARRAHPRLAGHRRHERRRDARTDCSRRSAASPSHGCAAEARWRRPTTASPTTSSPRSGRSPGAPAAAGDPVSSRSSWPPSTTWPRPCAGARPTTTTRAGPMPCAPACGGSSTRAGRTTPPSWPAGRWPAGPTGSPPRPPSAWPPWRPPST